MIYAGSKGSISFFVNDKLVCSSPLTKVKTVDKHFDEANTLILDGLRKGHSIQDIKRYFHTLKNDVIKKKKFQRTREDEKFLVMSLICLIRLNELDFDETCLVMGKKKVSKKYSNV